MPTCRECNEAIEPLHIIIVFIAQIPMIGKYTIGTKVVEEKIVNKKAFLFPLGNFAMYICIYRPVAKQGSGGSADFPKGVGCPFFVPS